MDWFSTEELRKFEKAVDDLAKGLNDAASKIVDHTSRELFRGTLGIRDTAIKSMRDTDKSGGKDYKRPGGKTHRSSTPYHPPAIDYGDLVRAITAQPGKLEAEVGAEKTAPHGYWMEYGTKGLSMSSHLVAPRPWLKPALDENIDKIISKIGDVSVELVNNPFRGIASRSLLR